MTLNNLGQLLTLLSYTIFCVSRFFKNKDKMLIFDNISRVVTIISFICLGSFNGIQNTIFSFIRNYCGQKLINKTVNAKRVTFVISFMIMSIVYLVSFRGISTIVMFICAVFNLIGVILLDEQGMRLCGLVGSILYSMFLYLIGNNTGFICEIICALVLISSYLLYKNKSNKWEK